jgi:hypothetical protein
VDDLSKRYLFFHGLEGSKPKIKVPAKTGSGEGPLFAYRRPLLCHYEWRRGEEEVREGKTEVGRREEKERGRERERAV